MTLNAFLDFRFNNGKLTTSALPSFVQFSSVENKNNFKLQVEKNTQLTLWESYESDHEQLNQVIQNIELAEGASLCHVRVFNLDEKQVQRNEVTIHQKKDSSYESFNIHLKAQESSDQISIYLQESGAHCGLFGLYALRRNHYSKHQTLIEHQSPHTSSEQLYKGILDDESKAFFQGKIIVAKKAQKINSSQTNRNLLLSKKAHVDTLPQLEIYADDVKCSHGATVGQLDEEQLFYLKSRGIPHTKALNLLLHAFSWEIFSKLKNKDLQKNLGKLLFEQFEKPRGIVYELA